MFGRTSKLNAVMTTWNLLKAATEKNIRSSVNDEENAYPNTDAKSKIVA